MPAADLGVRPRLFYGWTVVATAFLVLFMAYGTQYAFGVFLAALVEEFGWSRASLLDVFSLYAFVYSVFALGAGNALALLMRRDPETMGLRPDGAPAIGASARSGGRTGGWMVAQALRTQAFWMLYGVFAATWIPVFIPLVHLAPMARGLGVAPILAATLVSTVGVAAMAGRLLMGAASDRIGRRATLAVAFIMQAAAFVGFAWSHDLAALYAASVVFGFSYRAASTLFTATVADFVGREPRRAALLAGRVDGRVRSVRGGLHLRSRRRLPARVVAQRRLQRASVEPARLHAPARAARRDRHRGGLTPPGALA